MTVALSCLALAAAIGTILAIQRSMWKSAYIFRPAAMAAIILLAVSRPAAGAGSRYKTFIVAGLIVSLVGDVFMMLRKKRFVEGLAAFLIAQVLYVGAFLSVMPPRVEIGVVLPLFLYALFMMGLLFPRLGRMKAPVALYIFVLIVMAGLAAERYVVFGGTLALRAALGAFLFVLSDSFLAIDRFVKPLPAAQVFILGLYFPAQWLLALSV